MTGQFKEQGGAATMDPSPLLRWLTSKFVMRNCNDQRLQQQRAKVERQRERASAAHVVEYFHQVEDGYSHLAAQALQQFCQRYDIELTCHLVRGPEGDNAPEPELLLRLAAEDACRIAEGYGLAFPDGADAPAPHLVKLATGILAAQDSVSFMECAAHVGDALWSGDQPRLQALADSLGCASDDVSEARLAAGTLRRAELGHYSAAMFYYGKEWYWGVDRLYHLERRLAALGADQEAGDALLMPRPSVQAGPLRDHGSLTLEVYPSLRSPYTAIVFDRTLQLAEDTGVTLRVRPVLPMVMRGVPATRQKGLYIFSDALREAREVGVPYGNFFDPIGDPVRRCYALYPWACSQGLGNALLSSFLRAAFAEGVNTNRDAGLRGVVEAAGLDWREAQAHLADNTWQAILEENRLEMYASGLWGVPSFRLLDASGTPVLALWGQDRLWLVAREIQRQLAMNNR